MVLSDPSGADCSTPRSFPFCCRRFPPEDREKTAFVCHSGAVQYKRMPFGLTKTPPTFQRALDIILSGVKWQSGLIYLDDVIVYSMSEEEHLHHLDQVLGLFRAASVTDHRAPPRGNAQLGDTCVP